MLSACPAWRPDPGPGPRPPSRETPPRPSAALAPAPDLSARGPGAQRAASIPARPVASESRPRLAAAGLEDGGGRAQPLATTPRTVADAHWSSARRSLLTG